MQQPGMGMAPQYSGGYPQPQQSQVRDGREDATGPSCSAGAQEDRPAGPFWYPLCDPLPLPSIRQAPPQGYPYPQQPQSQNPYPYGYGR